MRGRLAGWTEYPIGWGPQPYDDFDTPWSEKAYCCGDLRSGDRPISGGQVVPVAATYGNRTTGDGRTARRFRNDARYLCVCWCGKTYRDADPADVLAGRTHVCGRKRCVPRPVAANHADEGTPVSPLEPVASAWFPAPGPASGPRQPGGPGADTPK